MQCFCMLFYPISFSNAKWIYISLESLMIEVCLHLKIYLDYFPRRLKYAELGKSMYLTFWVPVPKLLSVYHNMHILLFCIDLSTKPYLGLWFNHAIIFKMSVKIYTNFFLSLERYNFKINYLIGKMRCGMRVHNLLNNLVSSPLQHEYYFWHSRSKCYEKVVKFYPEIFEFKVFVWSNN